MDTLLATLTQVKNDCRSATASSVINRFYYEARQRQVPPEQLVGNPFRMVLPQALPPPVELQAAPHPASPDPEAQALAEAEDNIRDLTLQSVLIGSSGATAIISNNQILTVGQNVRGWTVVEIAPKQVVLQWKSHRHIMTMK
jgi:transposase